jgi:hypothetical protein
MPLPDMRASLECLDDRRLGKQRVETFQILRAMRGITKGWTNHPATVMWTGHEPALNCYLALSIDVWVSRGFKNTMQPLESPDWGAPMPWWFGMAEMHASHRSNLLRKMPEHYGRFGWKEGPDLPYLWPGINRCRHPDI